MFNEELQIDFAYFRAKGDTKVGRTMTDDGIGYTEVEIVPYGSIKTDMAAMEREWVCKHGNAKAVSGGDEFKNNLFILFLKSLKIIPLPDWKGAETKSVSWKGNTGP